MAEWGFLCRRVLARAFQANLENGPYNMAKGSPTHRIHLPASQPGLYILLSGSCRTRNTALQHR